MSDKPKPGRPSDYDPAYCDKVIELGALGKSYEQIASVLGVTYRTMLNWRDTYPDFFHAMEESKAREMAWWEDLAQTHMVEHKDGERLNPSLWSRSMSARFPNKYSDRIKQEITGENGAPLLTGIQVTFVKPDESSPA